MKNSFRGLKNCMEKSVCPAIKKALKAATAEHLRKLVENNQNIPRLLFRTVARLTNKTDATSTEYSISVVVMTL